MKPTIYFVSDTDRGKRHRAFSRTQPAFCGTVSIYSGWARVRSSASDRERKCRECAESPLNGEVELTESHYIPVEHT
jgi:hypothetical protein